MKRFGFVIFIALVLAGCEKRSIQPLGGGYFLEGISKPNYLMEPGGGALHLVYRKDNKEVTLSTNPFGFEVSIYRKISWHLYGANLVFVDNSSNFQLKAYSVKNDKVITLEPNLDNFWKVSADEKGIIAHRYQNGDEKDDPNPLVFTADYLSGL